MLRKRIIFTLLYNDGMFCQSRNFRLQKVGDIDWLNRYYKFQRVSFAIDELIILDVSKNRNIEDFTKIVRMIVENIFIPVSIGGGIRKKEDVDILFNNGADKLVLNTILYKNKELVKELIEKYGSQSIVASIDYKDNNVFIENGTELLEDMDLLSYIKYVESLGVGEIYLNSIDRDGTGFGYDIETIKKAIDFISIPLIVAGGAGNERHLEEGLEISEAVATANLFNFIGDGLLNARKRLLEKNINLARWK
jgi:cyclase